MSHTVHVPENSIGLNDVAFSADVETKPVCISFFFFAPWQLGSHHFPLSAAAQE